MREISYSEQFAEAVSVINSDRLLERLDAVLASIEAFPLLGSPRVQPSLVGRYGASVRKFPVPPFVIVYSYDQKRDRLEFIALPHERSIN